MNESSLTKFYLRHPKLLPELVKTLLEHFPAGVIALDLETTGLSPLVDRIIELSAIKVTPAAVETFSTLVNPQIAITPENSAIHGINDLMVASSPLEEEILPPFCQFIGSLPLIAHNAKFDSGFLAMGFHRNKLILPNNLIYCSLQMSKKVFSELPGHRLGQLVVDLNIPLDNHHRALDDAFAALILFSKCLARDEEKNQSHLEQAQLFKLSEYNKTSDFNIPDHLLGMRDKMVKRHLIWIKYKKGTYKNQFRPILPTSFLPMPGGNILYALCLYSGVYKSFGLTKITEWKEMTGEELAHWAATKASFDKKSET